VARIPLGTVSDYDGPGENLAPPNLLLALGHPAELADATVELFRILVQGDVPAKDRKLATLSIAAELRNGYEWGHHAPTAGRLGISGHELDAIRLGKRGVLDEHAQLVVDYAAAVERQDVTDGLWARAAALFSVPQLVQLTALSAFYGLHSRVQNALQVEQDAGFESQF